MSKVFIALVASAAVIGSGARAAAQVRESDAPRVAKGAAGSAVAAPARAETTPDSTHSYDTGALRFETSWGNVSILRGSSNTLVGTAGWFRDPGLEQLLASSPRALKEARGYQTQNFRGSLVGGIGALAAAVGIVVAANGSNDASSPILVIAGVSGMAWGAQHLSMSYAALSRALWWYNRDLSR
jgi:hypothetical protein